MGLQVLEASSSAMLAQIYFIPSTDAAKLDGQFFFEDRNETSITEDFMIDINITLLSRNIEIIQVSPCEAVANGGDNVTLAVAGMTVKQARSSLNISFGGISSAILSSKQIDIEKFEFVVNTPPHSVGISLLTIRCGSFSSSAGHGTDFVEAQIPFVFVSQNTDAACIQGCLASTNFDIDQTILLEFIVSRDSTSDLYSEILVPDLLSVDCVIFSPKSFAFEWKLCSVQTFDLFQVQMNDDPKSSFQIMVHFKFEIQNTTTAVRFDPKFGPNIPGYFILRSLLDTSFASVANFSFQAPPQPIRAFFSSDYTTVSIVFDQDIKEASFKSCSDALLGEGLGSGFSCVWVQMSEMLITLGTDSVLAPGESISLQSNLTSITGISTATAVQNVIVEPPEIPTLLHISVSGPSVIGPCDIAVIYVESTLPHVSFVWGCRNDKKLDIALKSQIMGSTLQINSSVLNLGMKYEISIKASTKFGLVSDTLIHWISLANAPVPVLTIYMPLPPYYRSQLVSFSGHVSPSTCASIAGSLYLLFTLVEVRGTPSANDIVIVAQSQGINLQPALGTIKSNQIYRLYFSVPFSHNIVVESEIEFYTSSEPLLAQIEGGNRVAYQESSILLDASKSIDQDVCILDSGSIFNTYVCEAQVPLQFSWTCSTSTGSPCLLKNQTMATLDPSPQIMLDLTILDLSFETYVNIMMRVSKPGQFAFSSTKIGISNIPVIDVQISVIYIIETGIAYQAVVSDSKNAKFAWSIQIGSENPLRRSLTLSDTSTFLSGENKMNFVIKLNTQWAEKNFLPGQIYTILLDTSTGLGSGHSWIEYAQPNPPNGGSCNISPLKGIALKTDFVMTCANWNSKQRPLQYRYSAILYNNSQAVDYVWSPASYSGRFDIYLPPGNFSIYSMIVDSQGTYTILAPITLCVENNGNFDLVTLSSFLDQLDNLFSISQIILLADAASSILIPPPSELCAFSSCRRLLGSSIAYRMSVRRLLLQKLSGSTLQTLSFQSAPSVLKTTKHISAVPQELMSDTVMSSLSLLVATCAVIGPRLIRGDSLEDSLVLGRSLLSSARAYMNIQSFETIVTQIVSAIITSSFIYASTMLEGENPLFLNISGIWLNVSFLTLNEQRTFISDSFQLTNSSNWGFNHSDLAVSVLKVTSILNVWNSAVWTERGSREYRSDILAVFLSDPRNSSLRYSTNHCLDGAPFCLTIALKLETEMPYFDNPEMSCLRWSAKGWDDTSCIVRNFSIINDTAGVGLVTCGCSTDGIFKIFLTSVPVETNVELFPKIALRFYNVQQGFGFVFLTVIVFVLSIFASSGLILLCSLLIDAERFTGFGPEHKNPNVAKCTSEFLEYSTNFSLDQLDSAYLPQFVDNFCENCYQSHLLYSHNKNIEIRFESGSCSSCNIDCQGKDQTQEIENSSEPDDISQDVYTQGFMNGTWILPSSTDSDFFLSPLKTLNFPLKNLNLNQ